MSKKEKVASSGRSNKPKIHPNAIPAQHACIEQGLRDNVHGLTTIQLVEEYDILRPGARICEMRWKLGLNIKSIRVVDTTAKGNPHYGVVRYVLLPGKWQGVAAQTKTAELSPQ